MVQSANTNPLLRLALEMGPLGVFFLGNAYFGIYTGTAIFMAATVIALGISYSMSRTIPIMPLVTAGFVVIFGGLTLYLADETFIKLKPTIVNLLFAAVLLVGLMTDKLFIKLVLQAAFHLTERGWILLTRAWIVFFIVLAALNEFVWRNFATDTWVNFKVFVVMPLTLVFSFMLLPVITRHTIHPDVEPEVGPKEGEAKSNVDSGGN